MNDMSEMSLRIFLSMFGMSLPVLLVSLIGIVAVASNWKRLSTGAIWAALGFGLALLLCFLVPLVQAMVQSGAMQGNDAARRASTLGSLAIVWSLLRAITYAFLLMGVILGRAKPQPGS